MQRIRTEEQTTMPTAILPPYAPAVIAERGETLYAHKIRPLVEAEHKGERLVIDIETGDYALEDKENPLAASFGLIERNPNAVLYAVRVGFPAATKMGGGWRVSSR